MERIGKLMQCPPCKRKDKILDRLCVFKNLREWTGHGHTLIELLIAMTVALIVIGAIYSVYHVNQKQYRYQQLVVKARQNGRAALVVTEQQIRMAGFDPEGSGLFGITDVRRYDVIGTQPNRQGQPAIVFTRDVNENGAFDGGREQIKFCIRKEKGKAKQYLAWDMGSGRFPLTEDIEGLGFAYAVDGDDDGLPDKCSETEHSIWAVDSDNDNRLDTNLDSNCDGRIDTEDDRDGDLRITPADGGELFPPIELKNIKAVRLWVLTVTDQPMREKITYEKYVLGDSVHESTEDGYQRNVLETVIICRNL